MHQTSEKIRVYKIGYDMYRKQPDKNGGNHEYVLILMECMKVMEKIEKTNSLIIIGGFLKSEEEQHLLNIMDDYSTCIFIATDSVNFDTCGKIIKHCKWCLHQSPKNMLQIPSHVKQAYSWVPELFYNPEYMPESPKLQHDLCLFGGATTGREDLAEVYLTTDSGFVRPGMIVITKDSMNDQRLPYDEFRKLMGLFKYSLCICREAYRDIGWVTPRFHEAIASWNYPLLDMEYDIYNHFKYDSADRVQGINGISRHLSWIPEHVRIEKIKHHRAIFESQRNKFVEVIEQCLQ